MSGTEMTDPVVRQWRDDLKSIIGEVIKHDDFRDLIREIARQELARTPHTCRFSAVGDGDAQEFGHIIGMVADLGSGRLGSGVEVIRDNHKWMQKQRQRSEHLSTAFLFCLVTSLVGAVLYAVWEGVVSVIRGRG